MQKFYYQSSTGKTFNNQWAAALYEKHNNTFIPFVTDLEPYRVALEDKNIDLEYNYDLDFLIQLRKEKNYIRLFYSGGSDSDNILQTCVKNNIFINEVVVLTRNLYNKPDLQNCDIEIISNVIPNLQKLTANQIGKISYVNHDADAMRKLYSKKDWMFRVPGGDITFRGSQPFKLLNDQTSDCQIIGKEKPQLIYYKDRWYATIIDNILNDCVGLHEYCYFYLEPRNIKSFIKTAIKYRNWIIDNNLVSQESRAFYWPYMSNKVGEKFNPVDYAGKTETVNISGLLLTGFINRKDKEAIKEVVETGDLDLLVKWCKSIDFLVEQFPQLKENNNISRNLPSKFPFFIDIDSLEIFSQNELIPDGFK